MDELLSRFPLIAEDIFENLDDESLVRCKEAGRSLSSFMDEGSKFWKRIIRKYLHNQEKNDFKNSWESLMDLKQTKPEMLRGHSTTTWTNFDPILTPSPPRVDKHGHSTILYLLYHLLQMN